MLKFLLGTDESSKSDEIYRRAYCDSQNNKTAFILVPEQYSMSAEQELISKLGLAAQNKIQILTFSRLVNMIFSKLGPLRTKYIDNAGKYLLACRSLQLCKNDLSFFGKNANQSGFGGLIVSLISEFKRYGVSPQLLSQQAKKLQDGALSAKLSDLALIYSKFNELMDENWLNAEDNLALAMSKIPNADFLSGNLYISYFRSFTPLEYDAIKMLMPKMDIIVSLCTDTLWEGSLVFSSQVLTYQNLCAAAAEIGIATEKPIFLDNSPDIPTELLHLRENYFTPRPKKFSGVPKSIHITKPQNCYAEVEYTARLITRLCRTKGYSLNDFLVLTGSPESYELILPVIFEKFGISFFLDQKLCLAESPFVRMFLSVLEILAFGFSYERIMTILRSGFWDIEKSEADIFENYILAADITHRQWRSRKAWAYNPRPKLFDMDVINQIKDKTVNRILDLFDSFSGRKDVRTICTHLCNWLNGLNMTETVSAKIDALRSTQDHEAADRLTRCWDSFAALINQISDCMADTAATFTEFYELFSTCSGELSVGIVPPTQDKVTISETERFRTTGAKVVIILGVLDKSFPKSYNADGLLSDRDRISLKEAGLTLAPDGYTRQKEEQFLIYSAFAAAKEELYLSSPMSDREGKSLGSSEVLKRIRGFIFPDILIEEDDELDLIEGKTHTFFELCAKLFECGFDKSRLSKLWRSVYDCFENDKGYAKKLDFFAEMYSRDSEPSAISKALAEKLYGSPLTLSVSKLEKYNSCAFSFFMKYGLLAEERLLGGLKATDTGTILHDVLHQYFKEKASAECDYAKINRSDCFEEISALVDDFAKASDNSMFTTSNYYGYMLMRLKNIASSTAWKLVRFYSKSEFRPIGFEVSFGGHGELLPYEIPTKNGPVFLKGFIDRVDSAKLEDQNYIAVTDYKSSEKRLDTQLIDAGITLQPLIYANAIAKSQKDTRPAALMYMQMNDPILKFENPPSDEEWEAELSDNIKIHGLFLDKPEVLNAIDPYLEDKSAIHYVGCDKKSRLVEELFEKRLEGAERCAGKAAEDISDGLIDANPPKISGFDPCEYCPYGSVCGRKS